MTADVLGLDHVLIRPGTVTQAQAIAEAAARLESVGAVTGDYLAAMLERERTVSTYMGNELAIPHGTSAAKGTVQRSAVVVLRYDGGVDWDGETVRFVIGIAGRGDEHLELLARIAVLFSDQDDVERLKAVPTSVELHAMLAAVND